MWRRNTKEKRERCEMYVNQSKKRYTQTRGKKSCVMNVAMTMMIMKIMRMIMKMQQRTNTQISHTIQDNR